MALWRNKFIFAVIGLVGFTATGAKASSFSEAFLAEGASVPNALLAEGYRQIGSLDLAQFVSQMSQVTAVPGSARDIGYKNDDGRTTAHWDDRRIIVNTVAWNHWTDQRPILALHEYLNFARFDDHEYRLSMGLWTLSLPDTRSTLSASELRNLEESLARMTYTRVAGGVIGVGGGGESATLWVRMKRVRESFERSRAGAGHDEVVQDLDANLNSNVTVSYPGAVKPATKRAQEARARKTMSHPMCLVTGGACEKPISHGYNDCTCPGSDEHGVIIYPMD